MNAYCYHELLIYRLIIKLESRKRFELIQHKILLVQTTIVLRVLFAKNKSTNPMSSLTAKVKIYSLADK